MSCSKSLLRSNTSATTSTLSETNSGRGDVVEIFPAESSERGDSRRVFRRRDRADQVEVIPLTGEIVSDLKHVAIYPASHYIVPRENAAGAAEIEAEMEDRVRYFKENGKLLEAQRIEQRTRYDIEMLGEIGMCKGIENYSRVMSVRAPGSEPCTLLNYFPEDFLLFVDGMHVTLYAGRSMYAGDHGARESSDRLRLPPALGLRQPPAEFR